MSRSVQRNGSALLVIGLASISGCASTPALSGGYEAAPMVVSGVGSSQNPMLGGPAFKVANRTTVKSTVPETWSRVNKAYSDLGIPLTTVRPNDHFLGNDGLKRSHTLANQRLSTYLDCGTGGGGPNADSYSVTMSIVSQLTALPDSTTEIATLVQATAKPMSLSTDPVVCATTSALEKRIASMVSEGTSSK